MFLKQFPAVPTLQSPKFARLEPVEQSREGSAGLFTLSIPATVEKNDISTFEAEAIARYVFTEVHARRRTFGDFLILTRKKKDIEVYADALGAAADPSRGQRRRRVRRFAGSSPLALLLRALADPQDGVSLVGVLRGPLFGLSDRDLFAYRQAGGWFSIFSDAPIDVRAAVNRVGAAMASLRLMHRWTQILPVGAAVERILEDSGYLALAATTPGGVEAGDLLHAVDRVRASSKSGYTLADAADALEPDADESSDVESLPLEPGRTMWCASMNLHKAKGLEAPVVFLADPLSGVKPRVDARIIREGVKRAAISRSRRNSGRVRRWLASRKIGTSTKPRSSSTSQAEEKRLLYVAATRAKEMLVIGRWQGTTSSDGPWGVFEGFLQTAKELDSCVRDDRPAPQMSDLSATAAAAAAIERADGAPCGR